MNTRFSGLSRGGICRRFAIAMACSAAFSLQGLSQQLVDPVGPFRTQTIQLQAGWNAVYLEIEPRKGDPAELFAGTPIEIVAAYNRPVTAMQFIDSPGDVLPDRKSWNVWYASHREDTLLSNLSAIQAHNSYLVYTEQAFAWSFEGSPFFGSARWHPNAFSLVGFPVNTAQQPTVAAFFAGASAHTPLKVYRMNSGQWSLITHPDQVLMQPGSAYWVYGKGASSFAGPLEVHFDGSSKGGVVFSSATNTRNIEIRSTSPFPQSLTFSLRAGESGLLPLSYVVRVLELEPDAEKISVPLADGAQFGPLEAGAAFILELEVTQESVTHPVMATTLVISSNAGSRIELPLLSLREDLLPTP